MLSNASLEGVAEKGRLVPPRRPGLDLCADVWALPVTACLGDTAERRDPSDPGPRPLTHLVTLYPALVLLLGGGPEDFNVCRRKTSGRDAGWRLGGLCGGNGKGRVWTKTASQISVSFTGLFPKTVYHFYTLIFSFQRSFLKKNQPRHEQ